jgi:methionyl aminopeptidase
MMRRRHPAVPVPIKAEHEQALMRRAGRVVALALAKIEGAIRPGITTGELDRLAEETIRGLGAAPAFLGYNGFPATACISVNEEVVHGIPGPRSLQTGDVVGVDLGAIVDGWYADAAYTYAVGAVSAEAQRLMDVGKAALAAGVAAARTGNTIRDIGAAVQHVAEAQGYSVVRDLCGHGIGRRLHEEPKIPNYITGGGNIVLRPGMTLAIEPMLNAGRHDVRMLSDGWTYETVDRLLSVHYEHTVLVTPDGPEILTSLR